MAQFMPHPNYIQLRPNDNLFIQLKDLCFSVFNKQLIDNLIKWIHKEKSKKRRRR